MLYLKLGDVNKLKLEKIRVNACWFDLRTSGDFT